MTTKDCTDTVSEVVAAIRSMVTHFQPSYTAKTGGSVIAPSIFGSHIENLNISVISKAQEEPSNNNEEAAVNLQIQNCQQKLKVTLKQRFSHLLESMSTECNRVALNSIYTELYITEGGRGEVNTEHEVRQIEALSKTNMAQEKSIQCNSIFEPQPGRERRIRTVLTRGVAGIGKTVSTNKFTLDWAEDKANADLDFVFPLCFRELNSMKCRSFSLEELLSVFFPEIKDLGIFTDDKNKMLFILDGLDESRIELDFQNYEIMSDVTQPNKLGVLLVNLIRGRLLPFAPVWITSRPAASNQIPAECIDLVTEVRGFNNPQKEEYFRRKIPNENLSNRVISHVKSCRSLHIMCHIPVFCWMAASVLEKTLSASNNKDTPKTLTQMYLQFTTLFVANMKQKLGKSKNSIIDAMRENLMSLGMLAFKELERGNLVFYESDLRRNGIDSTQASMFSGIYTEIFNEEPALCGEKMFCFVHLSVQEFFAALYVFLMFHNENTNVLIKKSSASRRFPFRDSSEVILYKEAVEKALRCDNGHYDIFLRFLLGLSLETNQSLLKHFMTHKRTNKSTRGEVINHIKERIQAGPPPDRRLNLFHCLNELNDRSLVEEIQRYIGAGSLNRTTLSASQWASLVFVLMTSEEELTVFELSRYTRSEEGLLRLQSVVKAAQVANLSACNLTVNCCETLSSVVSTSQIRELDLSNNDLTDAGIGMLCSGIKLSKVDTLRLKSCGLSERGTEALSSVLGSKSCQLRELDASDNDFEDRGVLRLSGGLHSPHCKLQVLNLALCRVTERGCTFLASALNSSRLRELDLSYNHPGHSGLQLLSTLLDDPQCGLVKLSVEQCGESRIEPGPKKYAVKLTLDPNTAHKDLSLSEENRKATRWTKQPYPEHEERFNFWTQVLCTEGLTGRCYWETEWHGRALIGAAYRRMSRKGEGHDSWLGRNDFSWGLNCTKDGYRAMHGGQGTAIAVPPSSDRVGVYLDWSGGKLSFFRVSCGELTHIYTLHSNFTEPLYPGFHLAWVDSSVCLR